MSMHNLWQVPIDNVKQGLMAVIGLNHLANSMLISIGSPAILLLELYGCTPVCTELWKKGEHFLTCFLESILIIL
jgi:hypothetical protein